MRSPVPALLTAGCVTLSLGLVLSACGSAEPGTAPETKAADATDATEEPAETAEPAPVDVPELLEGLTEAFGSVSSHTVTADVSADGLAEGDLTRTGSCTVMAEREAHHCVSEMPYAGELAMEAFEEYGSVPEGATVEKLARNEYISHDGLIYINDSDGIYGVDTPWLRSGNPEGSVSVTMPLDFEVAELSDLVDALSTLGGAEQVGTGEVDGGEAAVIEGTLDDEGLAALSEAQRESLHTLLGRTPEELAVTLWVDADGFPVRVELSGDGSEGVMEFSELGSASFDIPSDGEVTVR
ncbi:hypothetical protein NE857_05185 [Nocardiopsis exhalans]|uniref:Lipoprotein n=1 Tax=Nocardiopsis exhalans TaxID=163604 RepID=A0ABY5DBB4_9ACTN|nr:hypothetical protein [Nocardiopsis exhalans]USY21036.1 hypothetical protein NE857_05185 [Nocardiopsis exhalans]